ARSPARTASRSTTSCSGSRKSSATGRPTRAGVPSPEPVASLRLMAVAAGRRTKIVATIGPASDDHAMLRALAEAGMDGARLNFSHGTQEDHARRTETIRAVQEEIGRPLALIADLQGPKLRIGELE